MPSLHGKPYQPFESKEHWLQMALIFETVAEYDAEIEFIRTQMRKAITSDKWRLNTSQSDQQVSMNMKEIRLYLTQLSGERKALSERLGGSSVTSITVRRCY